MQKHLALLFSLLVIGCNGDSEVKNDFIGTWKSNNNLSADSVMQSQIMTSEQKDYLRNRFGIMQYIFTQKNATYAPINGEKKDNIYFSWEIIKDGNDKVVIEITGSFSRTEEIEFIRYKSCLGLYNSKYDYVEYFCKEDK